MKTLDIYNVLEYLKLYNKIDCEIEKFTIDTRKVTAKDCYIAIKGENNDGNKLFMDAFENGADLVILDNFEMTEEVNDYLVNNNKSILVVENTIKALGDLARYKRSLFYSPVVAITGSAGKTSTKDIVYSVLKEKYKTHKTIGNQNNQFGLPLTILSLDTSNEVLVLEMGMNHFGEISYLTNIAKPDIAIITNVGTAHIGYLGSRENILKAKLEILEGLNPNGTVIINNDNDLLHEWYLKNKEKYNIKTVGIYNESDFRANIIEKSEWSSTFSCNNEIYKVPIGGEHFIYNALIGVAVGNEFKVSEDKIKDGILNFELSGNRMNLINTKGYTIINDSYNANLDSMSYSVKCLGSMPGRTIAVLGTMKELGEYSKELHRKLGEVVSKEKINILVTVGDDAEYINEGAIATGFNKENSYHFENNITAINFVNTIKEKNDYILVKASLSLNFKEIVEGIK